MTKIIVALCALILVALAVLLYVSFSEWNDEKNKRLEARGSRAHRINDW